VVRRLKAVRTGARRPLSVLVGTITPSGGATLTPYARPEVNVRRQRIKRLHPHKRHRRRARRLRPRAARPHASRLARRYDSGDGLHPSSAGYRRMAQAVDLTELDGPAP
jgi:hypothetical protein